MTCEPEAKIQMVLETLNVIAPTGSDREREFNFGTHCVADLYRVCLGKFRTERIAKVIITATTGEHGVVGSLVPIGVIELRHPFDFNKYWASDAHQRKRLILELIHSGMCELALERGWEAERLEAAYRCALESNLRNVQVWPTKPVSSPDRSKKAEIEYDFDADSIEGSVMVLDRAGNRRAAYHMFSLPPTDFHLSDALGKLAWEDDQTVVLKGKTGEPEWRVRLPSRLAP
ncbi:MAG TPA: hypothetical protein VEW03_02415 [Longimicrobiaceae bacterium]|nr:hypothetical protein [Longimicrobiaceae bacterium]